MTDAPSVAREATAPEDRAPEDGTIGSEPEPEPARPARTTVRVYQPGEQRCANPTPDQISEIIQDGACLVWVDIEDPGPEEIDLLAEEFGFHRLALEDVVNQRQRPKVDEYADYLYLVLYAPAPPTAHRPYRTAQIDLFIGRNYVVTARRGHVPALEDAVKRWEHLEPGLRRGAGGLLHTIGDCVVDAYFPVVDQLEDQLDSLELALFRPSGRFDARRLLQIKRGLFTLRRAIYPLREVFNTLLRRDLKLFPPEIFPYFQDTYDHILRLLDTIDVERDVASGVLDAQLSVVSNRLNETMKRLTAIAVSVAVMGAVFGAWGMNFSTVPGAQLGLVGFALVAAGAVGLAGLTIFLGRWLRWW
jgi:magnesium transporter